MIPNFCRTGGKNGHQKNIPWLIFLWAVTLPCFAVLICIWKVSTAIKTETVFALHTARTVKTAVTFILADTVLLLLGNILFLLLDMNHPAVFLLSIFIVIAGISLAICAAVLARYLTKAAALQEEADATI